MIVRFELLRRSFGQLPVQDVQYQLATELIRRYGKAAADIFDLPQLLLHLIGGLAAFLDPLQHGGQVRLFDRLEQIVLCSILKRGVGIVKLTVSADYNNVDILLFRSEMAEKLQPAALRHSNICDNHIRPQLPHGGERVEAVVNHGSDFKAQRLPIHYQLQKLAYPFFVIR